MSTADKLNALVLTKDDIKLALIDKGLNPSDVFSTYADDIRAIETGGVFDFGYIGYTGEEEPLKSGLAYAKLIYDEYLRGNSRSNFQNDDKLIIFPAITTSSDLYYYFSGCKNLIIVPQLKDITYLSNAFWNCSRLNTVQLSDYSLVTEMVGAFSGCNSLYYVGTIDCSSCVNVDGMFTACYNLSYNPLINTGKVKNMFGLFQDCLNLNDPDFSLLNTSNVTTMSKMFACSQAYTSKIEYLNLVYFNTLNVKNMLAMFDKQTSLKTLILSDHFGSECTNMSYILRDTNSLTRVENLNVSSLSSLTYDVIMGYSDYSKLRYFLCKGIGTLESQTRIQFTYYSLSNWGVADEDLPDARQSLINSLITYSYDRARAGYSTSTICLSANSKALLTEDEIALITAKGYTIA